MNRRSTVFDKTRGSILALTLLACALRVYHLEAQSLWSDEGLSLYRARLTLAQNLSNVIVVPPNVPTQDTNPPFYFVLLSLVRAVAGESDYALRFLSMLAGVALVPLLYATGRRLFSVRTGVLAALLGALSPFLVWYSQEARMYTLLAALSLTSVYLLLRVTDLPGTSPDTNSAPGALKRKRWPGWISWAIVTAAALYTHFTAFFLLPLEALIVLGWLIRSRRREALWVVAALLVVALPIALYGLSRALQAADPGFKFRPLDSIAEEVWSAFSIGRTNETFQPLWAVAPALAIFVIGGIGGLFQRSKRIMPVLLGLAFVFVPFFVFYAATFIQPLFTGSRHLTLIASPFYLLVANGLSVTWRRLRILSVAALSWIVVMMLIWLRVQFFDPAYLKDDMRSAAQTIATRSTAEDVVVVQDAISSFVFAHYYTGAAPWTIIPTYPSLDVDAALSEFQVRAQSAQRVWFVTDPTPLSGFPPGALDEWARGHLLRLDHQRFPSIWLGSAYQLYTSHFPIEVALPASASAVDRTWSADGLHLAGVASPVIAESRDKAATTLFWKVDKPLLNNLVITQRLVDDSDAEWGLLIGTAFDNWSAKDWPVGKFIRQDATILLLHGAPPGRYHLRVSVAEKQSGIRLTLPDGSTETEVTIANVQP